MSHARIHGLDTLRALAVALVVLHHYTLFVSAAPTFGWVGTMGWAGVDIRHDPLDRLRAADLVAVRGAHDDGLRAGALAGVVDGLEVQLAGGNHASCSKEEISAGIVAETTCKTGVLVRRMA